MSDDDVMLQIYKLFEEPSKRSLYQMVKERSESIGISDFQMSKILNIKKDTFSRLLKKLEDGNVDNVDFYSILKLCQLLGISVDDMSQVYVASLKSDHIKELEQVRKASFIINHFDLKGLRTANFIENTTDFEHIEKRIVEFFQLNTIFEWKTEIGAVAFSRPKGLSHDKMREFWVRSALYQFEKIDNPNEYARENLTAIIPKIAAYTRYEEKGFWTVMQALYNIGITVIVQSYLNKTHVRGGTFVVNGKPCIVVTDFNKSYSTLWFALMHELYHVLYDLEQLETLRYHLTGEAQSDLYLFREESADYFACEMLFPKNKLDFIKSAIRSHSYVLDYAQQNKIHPSIIYSFYCYDQKDKHNNDEYALYQSYFGKSEKAIALVKSNPFDKKTIYEGILKIKQILNPEII